MLAIEGYNQTENDYTPAKDESNVWARNDKDKAEIFERPSKCIQTAFIKIVCKIRKQSIYYYKHFK